MYTLADIKHIIKQSRQIKQEFYHEYQCKDYSYHNIDIIKSYKDNKWSISAIFIRLAHIHQYDINHDINGLLHFMNQKESNSKTFFIQFLSQIVNKQQQHNAKYTFLCNLSLYSKYYAEITSLTTCLQPYMKKSKDQVVVLKQAKVEEEPAKEEEEQLTLEKEDKEQIEHIKQNMNQLIHTIEQEQKSSNDVYRKKILRQYHEIQSLKHHINDLEVYKLKLTENCSQIVNEYENLMQEHDEIMLQNDNMKQMLYEIFKHKKDMKNMLEKLYDQNQSLSQRIAQQPNQKLIETYKNQIFEYKALIKDITNAYKMGYLQPIVDSESEQQVEEEEEEEEVSEGEEEASEGEEEASEGEEVSEEAEQAVASEEAEQSLASEEAEKQSKPSPQKKQSKP